MDPDPRLRDPRGPPGLGGGGVWTLTYKSRLASSFAESIGLRKQRKQMGDVTPSPKYGRRKFPLGCGETEESRKATSCFTAASEKSSAAPTAELWAWGRPHTALPTLSPDVCTCRLHFAESKRHQTGKQPRLTRCQDPFVLILDLEIKT